MTSYDGDVLSQYSVDGGLVTRVNLPESTRARHAVQTVDNTFVVCRTMPRHDVIEVDALGHVIRAYNGELNWPRRLTVAADGDVIVLDSSSCRVLLVDDQLRLKRILLSGEQDGLKGPWRMCYTPDNGHLVMGEVWKVDEQLRGRVAVYNLI